MPILLHTPPRRTSAHSQRGLTLIEMLISIALGLVVVATTLYVYSSSKGSYRSGKSVSRVQESAQFALDALGADLRQAGYLGCGSRVSIATGKPMQIYQLATPALSITTPGQSVTGSTAAAWLVPANLATVVPVITPNPAGDILTVHTTTGTASIPMQQPPDFAVPAIYLANNCANVQHGAYIVMASCSMATVLRVSNNPGVPAGKAPSSTPPAAACPGPGPAGVAYNYKQTDETSGAVINVFPGGSPSLQPTTNGSNFAPSLSSRPSVQVFDEVTYFVAKVAGRPYSALYRYSKMNNAAGDLPEEVSDHVDQMCVMYGVPGAAGFDFIAAGAVADWTAVTAVQVSLLVSGDDQGAVDAPMKVPPMCGTAVAIADTRYHQVVTTTVAIRNSEKLN